MALQLIHAQDVTAAASQAIVRAGSADVLRVTVLGTEAVRIKFGDSNVTAAAGDAAVRPDSPTEFKVPDNASHVAVFAGSSSNTNLAWGREV